MQSLRLGSIAALFALGACAPEPIPSTGNEPATSAPPYVAPPPIATAATTASASAAASASPPAPRFMTRAFALPGASGAVSLDYLAVDRKRGAVWIPAGGTGSADAINVASGKLTRVEGFPTVEKERDGKKRVMGPSSASVGDGVVYVGNRANQQVCAIDAVKMTLGKCVALPSSPDGLQYVASTKELWVTTPRDSSITVLDATKPGELKAKTKIALEGSPEGYAVDEAKGVFYTNLEDKNATLAVDVKTKKVASRWEPKCGSDGPRGLAIDAARGFLVVACTDHLVALDAAHGGAILSSLDTGGGVDNIDYLDATRTVYAAAGKTATLTMATLDDKGALAKSAEAPTSQGARVVVADGNGVAYVADGANGRVLAIAPAK